MYKKNENVWPAREGKGQGAFAWRLPLFSLLKALLHRCLCRFQCLFHNGFIMGDTDEGGFKLGRRKIDAPVKHGMEPF